MSAIVLLLVALAATGAMLRPEVLFLANFDGGGDGTGSTVPVAETGFFVPSGSPDAFMVEYTPATETGVLLAQNTAEGATLLGLLDPSYAGDRVTASVKIKPRRAEGRLVLRLADEDDTPMIDVEFTPEGTIVVAGAPVGTYVPEVTYTLTTVMVDPFMGPTTASVAVAASNGVQMGTPVVVLGWGSLTLGSISVLMPAGEVLGEFALDDFLVQANSSSFKKNPGPK